MTSRASAVTIHCALTTAYATPEISPSACTTARQSICGYSIAALAGRVFLSAREHRFSSHACQMKNAYQSSSTLLRAAECAGTSRLVHVNRSTVARHAVLAGNHAQTLHDELVAFSPSDT